MSAGLINAVRDLTKRIEVLEKRNIAAPVAGAFEAVLALIEKQTATIAQLNARMEAQEQRRGPGRPPKDRDEKEPG